MSLSPKIYLSFIIPAKNEEDNIAATLRSILTKKLPFTFEVIVVDHCSTDGTAITAKKEGAKVVQHVGGTISAVRNKGVNVSRGEILIFIDSDVSITDEWVENIEDQVVQLGENPLMVSGSHCTVPSDGGWLERLWFSKFSQSEESTHLGSGHLIMKRDLFKKLGGFSENLLTGEDYDICLKAKKIGGTIQNNASLKVIHRDYPKNIKQFIQREAWHGSGDTQSISMFFKSKVAIASLAFVLLHLLVLISMFWFENNFIFYICILLISMLILLSSWLKFKHNGMIVVLRNALIFYLYYLGRSMSIFFKNYK